MKGFKGLKLWPNATGNILMLVSIILVAIIVIGGLVWGFSSKKENFYSQTEPKTAIIKNVLPSPFKKTTTDVIQIAREAMVREAAAKEVAKETSRIAQAAREAAQVAIAREAQAARPMQARPTPVFLSQAVQPMSKQGMMMPVFKQ